MKRGDVYDVRLDPIEGSEQAGTRRGILWSGHSLSLETALDDNAKNYGTNHF